MLFCDGVGVPHHDEDVLYNGSDLDQDCSGLIDDASLGLITALDCDGVVAKVDIIELVD